MKHTASWGVVAYYLKISRRMRQLIQRRRALQRAPRDSGARVEGGVSRIFHILAKDGSCWFVEDTHSRLANCLMWRISSLDLEGLRLLFNTKEGVREARSSSDGRHTAIEIAAHVT